MALKGNLETFRLEEILQLIASQRKTGVLNLASGEKRVPLVFDEGRITSTHEPLSRETSSLEASLARLGRISGTQLAQVAELRHADGSDPQDLILGAGLIPPEELARFVEEHIQDQLMRALSWRSGNYEFINHNPTHPQGAFQLAFRTEGVLMEAMRRQDEMARFRRALTSRGVQISRHDLSLAREQDARKRRILEAVATPHTLGDLEESLPLWLFELYEGIYELWEAGVLEVQGAQERAQGQAMRRRLASSPVEQFAFGAGVAVAMVGVALVVNLVTSHFLAAEPQKAPSVWEEAQVAQYLDDVRLQAETWKLSHGSYPARVTRVPGWKGPPQGAPDPGNPAVLAGILSDGAR